jgi:hypothetical protein
MRKFYSPLFLTSLASCVTQVSYLGTSYPTTRNVDVFVTQASVKKPFDVIGKGYLQRGNTLWLTVEGIQQKAVEKAKTKGADGVIIEDRYLIDNSGTLTTRTDSIRGTQTSYVNSSIASGFNILFIKYKE